MILWKGKELNLNISPNSNKKGWFRITDGAEHFLYHDVNFNIEGKMDGLCMWYEKKKSVLINKQFAFYINQIREGEYVYTEL